MCLALRVVHKCSLLKIRLNLAENGPASETRGSEEFATKTHVMDCVRQVPRFLRVCPHCPRSTIAV